MKIARRLPQAEQDIKAAARYYAIERAAVANLFLHEVKRATSRIEEMPAIGSPHFAVELDVEGLRAYPLRNFPYLLFYFEYDDHIDLVRVLHSHRDVFGLSFET